MLRTLKYWWQMFRLMNTYKYGGVYEREWADKKMDEVTKEQQNDTK